MLTLLTIDDEREFTSMIRLYFEPRGFKVIVAHDGDSGIELARREKPEVALIDLKMPGKHGDEVLMAIKSMEPKTVTIMITASEGEGKTRERLKEMGANECFDKPLNSLKELEDTIRKALKQNG